MLILILLFFMLILSLIKGLFLVNRFKKSDVFANFSIIIAHKNDYQNLGNLLKSIGNINYPREKYEIIIVDDNSEQFLNIHNDFLFIKSNGEGKKKAIDTGIKASKFEWIVLTDADCIVPDNWLEIINLHIQNSSNTNMFIGYSPETYLNSFKYFKQLVNAINYAATTFLKLPFSCTGRNLVFDKKSFFEVDGYEGLFAYPAGDDKLLLNRFLKYRMEVSYMPAPKVYTKPVTQNDLKNQNLRRYGKFKMSTKKWQIGILFIGILLISIPFEIILLYPYSILFLLLYISFINMYIIFGCILHKENVKLIYSLYTVFFPYYLIWHMLNSSFRKWSWK